jgi:LDH2 family malate/lactate/ureidoglycolate dehydrogenase
MDDIQIDAKYTKVTASNAQSFVEGVLIGNGVPPENAAIVAKHLVQADLRGVDTHGMNRIPSYMARVRQGVLDPKATPSLTKLTPVVAQVSNQKPL